MLPRGRPRGASWFLQGMNIHEFLQLIRDLAPERLASPWDNSGVQVAGPEKRVRKAAVTLDPEPGIVARALDWGADLVLSHHPLFLKPEFPSTPGRSLDILRLILTKNAWLYAAHTSLDARVDGPARWLGDELDLLNRAVLEPAADGRVLAVGAALAKALPTRAITSLEAMEGVRRVQSLPGELRLYCEEASWPAVRQAVSALVPSGLEWFVSKLENAARVAGFGEIGDLSKPLAAEAFLARLQGLCRGRTLALCGPQPKRVRRVAYCPGSGSTLMGLACEQGADVLVTGDVKHHAALEAGLLVVDVGHFVLEEEMMRRFAVELAQKAQGVSVRFFEGDDPFRFRAGA